MESFADGLVEVVRALMDWLTTTLGPVAVSIGEAGTALLVLFAPGLLMYGATRLVVRGMRVGFAAFDMFATLLIFAVVLAAVIGGGATGGLTPFLAVWFTAAVTAAGMGLGSYRALGARRASALAATLVLLTPLFALVHSL